MTVLDYFHLGLQRGKQAVVLPVVGEMVWGSTGLTARYQLRVEQGVVQQVSFTASTCVALVAYCEVLAQWTTGMLLRDAICIGPDELADRLVGVPISKRDRAWLAVRAMHYAVVAAVKAFPSQNQVDNS